MSQFDFKIFNAEVFGKYLERIPRVKQNKLLEAGILRTRGELKTLLSDQTGGNYVTVPMLGLIDGEPQNYDGALPLVGVFAAVPRAVRRASHLAPDGDSRLRGRKPQAGRACRP